MSFLSDFYNIITLADLHGVFLDFKVGQVLVPVTSTVWKLYHTVQSPDRGGTTCMHCRSAFAHDTTN